MPTSPRAAALALLLLVGLAPVAQAQRAGPDAGADPALAAVDLATLVARGDSAWSAGREGAFPFYHEIVRRDSTASTRALFRLAMLRAWRGELPAAIALHARYVRAEPMDGEGRVALGRVLAWAGRFDAAVANYDTLLARIPDYRDAALGRAQALAWAGRTSEAIAAYERWLAANPTDRAAELDLARAQSWGGRLEAAELRYQRLADGGDVAGDKGVARVAAWRGDLARSERLWRAVTERHPDDAEAWTGLAQVLRWSGRAGLAERALARALEAEPGYGDARAQLPWVRAELDGSAEPMLVLSNDSDENRSALVSVGASRTPFWTGRVSGTLSHRQADFAGTQATSTTARTSAVWHPMAARVSVRGELGLALLAGDRGGASLGSVTRSLMSVGVSAQPHRVLNVGVGLSRAPFDETALMIANRLVNGSLDADASLQLPGRLTLGAGAGRGEISGGRVRNARESANASLRWTIRRGLSLAASGRAFGYERAAFDTVGGARVSDGYFAPEAYRLVDGSGRWELGRDLGWHGSTELGLGRQMLRPWADVGVVGEASSRFTQRAAASLGYRFAPGLELASAIGFANVAGPQTIRAAEYRAWWFTLRGRVRL